MADIEQEQQDNDILELTEEAPPEEQHQEPEPEEFAIEIEGEEPEAEETPLVKQLRQRERDLARELDGYRKAATPKKIEVGKKPDLWDDCEGDADKFETELSAWQDRKREAEQAETKQTEQQEVANQTFRRALGSYQAKAAALPVPDFDQAQQTVMDTLPVQLQSALVLYLDSPEKVVYALHKHPAKLAALANETDPIKFVLAAKEVERNLKVVNRRKPPEPEAGTIQRSSAPIATSTDKVADKLFAAGQKSGDMTDYYAHQRAMRKKNA